MKTIKIITMLLIFGFTVAFTTSFAQTADSTKGKDKAIKITKYEAGKTLTKTDLEFLAGFQGKTRGENSKTAITLDNNNFTVGKKINSAEATLINNKITAYKKNHPGALSKTRGQEDCCFYEWECDAFGCDWFWICFC